MPKMKIGVLGSGVVGDALASGLIKHGYHVMRGSRDPKKLAEWKRTAGAYGLAGTFEEAAHFGQLIVLAVKGLAAESVLDLAGAANLRGKTVIDTTNPIVDAPPTNGVLRFFTNFDQSLMERLQDAVPDAHFVKAFSSVGSSLMVNPEFSGGIQPTMFICGNHEASKAGVREILTQFGWETADMGTAEAARAIEPLCMLWCIPGLTKGQWGHAFKLLQN